MTNMTGQLRLTKEESAVMDECRRNSFWYRSVPLMSIATAVMTYQRINGRISPKFYGFKLATTVFGAYVIGKFSYVSECRRIILQRLPDSNLARSIESKPLDLISDMAQPPEIVPKSSTTNIFGNKDDADDSLEADFGKTLAAVPDKVESRKYVTYDELRQKSRAEYAAKFSGVKPRTETPAPIATAAAPADNRIVTAPAVNTNINSSTSSSKLRSTARKNQYGDEVYD